MPATEPTTRPVSALVYDDDVKSLVCPPPGWHLDPVKRTEKHVHKTWLSPSGDTAYGLIWIRIPVPLTESMVLWGFMDEMKKSEGEATLLAKGFDEAIDALRFEAEGGLYHIRVIMKTKGRTAYCVYAGTLRAKPVREDELAESVSAREATQLGEGAPK